MKETAVAVAVESTPVQNGKRERNTKSARVEFFVGKDFVRRFRFENPDGRKRNTTVYHAYPCLSDWVGRALPDDVNPRSHEEESLRSPVAREIEKTILERPDEFVRANRGSTIVAEDVEFDEKTGKMAIIIKDPANQGVADGGTTDAIIARVQRQLLENKPLSEIAPDDMPEQLKTARIHLEIWMGLTDREQIAPLVAGRNTSRQVKQWTLADFQGKFNWLKEDVFGPKSQFGEKIGYEENSLAELNVLDVLAFLTVFHPEYDTVTEGEDVKTPTIAYSGKGRLEQRLQDPETEEGYKNLAPIVEDILALYEHIYSTFDTQYVKAYGKGARLGRRYGVRPLDDKNPLKLPLTGKTSLYRIPSGYLFPILNGFRALVGYRRTGEAFWRKEPQAFWNEHGSKLVRTLMTQAEELGGNPNRVGKQGSVYSSLYDKTKIISMGETEK